MYLVILDLNVYRACHIDSPFDPTNTFQTSNFLRPALLNGLRLLFATYMFTTEIYNLAHDAVLHNGGDATHWSYFTNITYWSFAFYFLFAGFHGLMYARTGHAPLQRWPMFLQLCHALLYTTVTIYPVLVTIVFWVLLADGATATTFSTWSNISVHAMNSFFCLFEIIVPRTNPHPWMFLPFVILFLACYLALSYITYATEGFYTYDFLDPRQKGGSGLIAAYVFGILVAIIIIFSLSRYVIWTRKWLLEKKLGTKGKFAKKEFVFNPYLSYTH